MSRTDGDTFLSFVRVLVFVRVFNVLLGIP